MGKALRSFSLFRPSGLHAIEGAGSVGNDEFQLQGPSKAVCKCSVLQAEFKNSPRIYKTLKTVGLSRILFLI